MPAKQDSLQLNATETDGQARESFGEELHGTEYAQGSWRRRGNYVALSMDEHDGRGSTDGVLPDDFPVIARKGPVVRASSRESWVHSPERIYDFLQSERPILAPVIRLRLTFFQRRAEDGREKAAWTATIPIHRPRPLRVARGSAEKLSVPEESWSLGLLRAVEDSAPCLRSVKELRSDIYERGGEFAQRTLKRRNSVLKALGWKEDSTQLAQSRFNAWNSARKGGLEEPWRLPSSTSGERPARTDTKSLLPVTSEDREEVVRGVRLAVQDFVDDNTPRHAKILRMEHIPHGWDLPALETAIEGHILRTMPSSGVSKVQVAYEPLPRWLELQILQGRTNKSTLSMDSQDRTGVFQRLSVQSIAIVAGPIIIPALMFFGVISVRLGCLVQILWLVLLLIHSRRVHHAQNTIISDTIMLAHPLKMWQHTGCPADSSREQVLQTVFGEDYGDEVPAVELELREDGWFVRQGLGEDQWLRDHAEFLKDVVRKRMSGDLSEALSEFA